jgi:hypothetical protein
MCKRDIKIGDTFGRLTVTGRDRHTNGFFGWVCACVCGKTICTLGTRLRSGGTRSCGCLHGNRDCSHRILPPLIGPPNNRKGFSDGEVRSLNSWNAMRARCLNPNCKDYRHYGGRGIKICDRWRHTFANFLSDMGERPSGLTIDRIDNDGDYSPENCRWATQKTQCQNRRDGLSRNRKGTVLEAFGESKRMLDWASDPRCSVAAYTIYNRLQRGWNIESAISRPRQTNLVRS